jgi:hypothetical protein
MTFRFSPWFKRCREGVAQGVWSYAVRLDRDFFKYFFTRYQTVPREILRLPQDMNNARVRFPRLRCFKPGFRSCAESHEQGANLPQRRQCILPLRRRQLSVRSVPTLKQMEQRAGAKKDFENKHSTVFATPGLPLAHFSTAESGLNTP